jgi:hypothetical protein
MFQSKSRIAAAGTAIAVATSATAVLLLGGGSATAADRAATAALPADSVTGLQIKDGTVWQSDLAPVFVKALYGVYNNTVTTPSIVKGAVTEDKLAPAVQDKLNNVGNGEQGPQGPKGDTGAQGPAGKDGKDAIVSVTALSNLTNRPDSSQYGNWAIDTMARTVSITKQGAVPASNCGAGATSCYFYTGSMIDSGTFKTTDGAKSPGKGLNISGTVQGTISGGAKLEFYATSDAPDVSLVQGNVDGAGDPAKETTTETWVKQFFPGSDKVTNATLNDWKWTYTANGTCEVHTQSASGNTGDIAGANACN